MLKAHIPLSSHYILSAEDSYIYVHVWQLLIFSFFICKFVSYLQLLATVI